MFDADVLYFIYIYIILYSHHREKISENSLKTKNSMDSTMSEFGCLLLYLAYLII